MGAMDHYTCNNCGSDINYDNIFFYFDGTKEETIDFLHLFSTVGIDGASKIKGRINVIFCKHCNKTFKIYIIEECDIKNPKDLVCRGIFNHIKSDKQEIQRLKEIKKRKNYKIKKEYHDYYKVTFPEYYNDTYSVSTKFKQKAKLIAFSKFNKNIDNHISALMKEYENDLNSIYLILDERNRAREDYNPLEKVCCPECNNEVYKWINEKTPCPKCGGKLLYEGTTHYD